MIMDTYEKKYKEANHKVAVRFGTNVAKEIFTDLYESEDERMMNQLHSWMKEFGGAEEYTEKVYQWIKGLLEKQGKKKSSWSDEQIKVIKEVYADILSAKGFDLGTINRELNRMEEQLKKIKIITPFFNVGDTIIKKK